MANSIPAFAKPTTTPPPATLERPAVFRSVLDAARRLTVWMTVSLAVMFAGDAVRGVEIYFNLDANGTTANQNLYLSKISGTTQPATLSGTAAVTWADRGNQTYRDYLFRLSTTTGTVAFDAYAVQMSAIDFNNADKFEGGNRLRSTIWSGTIPPIPSGTTSTPLFSTSLGNNSVLWDSFNTTSYETAVLGPSPFAAQLISPTPSFFFIRIWADGNVNVDGFKSKLAETDTQLSALTIYSPDPRIQVEVCLLDGTTYSSPLSSFTPIVVPEPSTYAMAITGIAFGGYSYWRRRRRLARHGLAVTDRSAAPHDTSLGSHRNEALRASLEIRAGRE